MRMSEMIFSNQVSQQTVCKREFVAMVFAVTLACLACGCGKHEPSYKDRIGTIDPATAPVIMPDAPAPPPKKQR